MSVNERAERTVSYHLVGTVYKGSQGSGEEHALAAVDVVRLVVVRETLVLVAEEDLQDLLIRLALEDGDAAVVSGEGVPLRGDASLERGVVMVLLSKVVSQMNRKRVKGIYVPART